MPKIKYNNLQILRFGAALGVLLFHAGHYLQVQAGVTEGVVLFFADPHFSRGVYLFFAISGFVLTHSILNTSIPRFLSLRFLRIYPPFLLCVAFILVAKLVFWGGYDLGNKKLFLASLTLLPFGPISYPLGIEWSLIYEVFFYMVLALVLIPRSRRVLNAFLCVWVGAIVVPGFFIPGGIAAFLPTYDIIFFSSFNLSFIAGIIAYQIFDRARKYEYAFLFSAIIFFLATEISNNTLYVQGCLSISFGSLVCFMAIRALSKDASSRSALVKLGDYSYGIYLVHVPIITVLLAKVPKIVQLNPYFLFVMVVGLALSMGGLYGAIELGLYQRMKVLVTRGSWSDLWHAFGRFGVIRLKQ